MATEQQIAANRRIAANSTGPRSRGGKKRASRNSYRHGLAAALVTTEEHAKRVEKLARRIAGNTADLATLEHARRAAEAEFELARVRKFKVALIEGMFAFGAPEVPKLSIPAELGQPSQMGFGCAQSRQKRPSPTRRGSNDAVRRSNDVVRRIRAPRRGDAAGATGACKTRPI